MRTFIVLFSFILFLLFSQSNIALSQTTLPVPDHVVIAILENHSYHQIIGSSAAPYINSLANDTSSALFTESYGIMHPSQPNYLILFSGSTQGVTNDLTPTDTPFSTANIGRQLIDAGKSCITYSEDLPEAGYNGVSSGYYARRHNPATNWMGTGINQIPPTTNQPFAAFASSDFNLLPTVSFVIPNVLNDMHNGTDPTRIKTGDDWILANLNSYIQWAKTNNSLFILTFDEDNSSSSNQIVTIFTGQMVQQGLYSTKINHYSILHTLEKIYELPVIGDSTAYAPIAYCWKQETPPDSLLNGLIYPNPANRFFYVGLSDYRDATAEIYNLKGELIQVHPLVSKDTELKINELISGYYLVKIRTKEGIILRRFIKK